MAQDLVRRFLWTFSLAQDSSGREKYAGNSIGPKRHYLVGNWNAKNAYDAAAGSYDNWHWQEIWRSAEDGIIESIISSHPSARRIMDVGCGTGSLIKKLLTIKNNYDHILGIDVSAEMLSRAKSKIDNKNVSFINDDIQNVDLPEKYFDIVFMMRVGSHIKDLDICFCKIASSLREGGLLVFSDVYSRHNYKYTRLPFQLGKIPVKTYKHNVPEIVKYAYDYSLILKDIKPFVIKDFPDNIKKSARLPSTLLSQIENNTFVPFGSLFVFELM